MIETIDDAILYFKTEKPKQPRSEDSLDKCKAFDMAVVGLTELKKKENENGIHNNVRW